VDEHLALVQGGTPYFIHMDGLGSVTRITDAGQNIVQSYSYASFGQPTISIGFQQPYLFTGREYDPETGLNYHRARHYSTDLWCAKILYNRLEFFAYIADWPF